MRRLVLQLSRDTRLRGLQIEGRREADDWLCFYKCGFVCKVLQQRAWTIDGL